MTSFHCLLLIAFFFHSCPPFATAQYIIEQLLKSATMGHLGGLSASAVYQFTTDLHKAILDSNPDGNVFFSPISLFVGLTMLYTGSGGETKSQLKRALHLYYFESKEKEFNEYIQILLKTLNSTNKNYTLKMANRLFVQKGFEIKDEYLRITGKYFRAELEALDFVNDPSGSRSKINNWVSRMTSEKIKELFPTSAITSDTVLALANAVYFNGTWKYEFEKRMTRDLTFSKSRNETIQVPAMHLLQSKGLRYSASTDGSFRLLELPYSDENVSMIIALGGKNGEFNTLLRTHIPDTNWSSLVDVQTNVPVRLSLPKFNLQQTLNLKKSLPDLGIKNLFTNANLSGIADSRRLELSDAIHKAYINVDEKGTQAAGATGSSIRTKSMSSSKKKIIEFIVDQPFIFLVVEKSTGCILFFGHIQNPLKSYQEEA